MRGVIKASDFVSAQFLHLRPRPLYKVLGILVVATFVWAAWLSLTSGDVDVMDYIFVALPIYLVYHFVIFVPRNTRKIYDQQKSLQGELLYTFDDSGLTVESKNGNWTTPWADYVKWKKNDKLMLIYLSDCMYHMLPLRLAADTRDFDKICDLVREKVATGRS